MHRYFAQISYNGSNFHGWQRQNNAHSIQQEIEHALSLILKTKTVIYGCGRTDTGVHALYYIAHFEVEDLLNTKDFIYKINSVLPSSIAFNEVFCVHSRVHARHSALCRTYEYRVHTQKNPFLEPSSLYVRQALDVDCIDKACAFLIGKKDFTSFCKNSKDHSVLLCDLMSAQWAKRKGSDTEYLFTIKANHFLRGMVRSIVGTLLDVGKQKITPKQFAQIIEAKDRKRASASAKAHGLYLKAVSYPSTIYLNA